MVEKMAALLETMKVEMMVVRMEEMTVDS